MPECLTAAERAATDTEELSRPMPAKPALRSIIFGLSQRPSFEYLDRLEAAERAAAAGDQTPLEELEAAPRRIDAAKKQWARNVEV